MLNRPVSVALLLVALLTHGAHGAPAHGVSMHEPLKYAADFTHFDYVNPDAPKGGELRMGAMGTFDSLNPFTLQGNAARGLGVLYDTLTRQSSDEIFAEYGLLAETIDIAEDNSAVEYVLRSEARWHDGQPITAQDVVFSFNKLREELPLYKQYYADVEAATALDSQRVRFDFVRDDNPELPMIMGQLIVIPKHYWSERDLSKATSEPPLGSGAYRIESFEQGRYISYERVEDYWGQDLPVNRGKNNFDRFRFDYFRDRQVTFEAFKSGDLDVYEESISKNWALGYDFPALKEGFVKKEELADTGTQPMQGYGFNTRRAMFSDRRVREAIAYAFDFEWSNKNLFYGAYQRTDSYFLGSGLRATGMPSADELALLEPLRGQIPDEVFERAFSLPQYDGSGNIRSGLRVANTLLNAAGWTLQEGVRANAAGEPLALEITLASPAFERITLPLAKNLERLGITATVRTIDVPQYIERMETFDFDMVVVNWLQSDSPGNEQRDFWGSVAATEDGSRNYAGISDPAIDSLIESVIKAPDREALRSAVQALDRVLLWGHYVIPQWFSGTHRVAYWDKYARPEIVPRGGLDFLETWWWREERAAEVLARQRPQ